MKLNNDISRCKNDKCSQRHSCARFMAESNDKYVWFSEFKPNKNKCEHKIEIEK